MRRRSTCRLCSGHGRSIPVGNCAECGAGCCGAHLVWVDDRWLCAKCARALNADRG